VLETHHSGAALVVVPILRNGVHDVLVKPAEVVDAMQAAMVTVFATRAHVPVERLALARLIEIVTVRVHPQKTN